MAPPARGKSSWSTPLLILSFVLVFFILFNENLRIATGEWAGAVLNPIFGFGGHYPVVTIFLASVLLVVATTVIRHFLVDWTAMARTQEAMRAFQKEFSEARKSNNTYKMKKLTEAQPKVFELQANLQKDQLKPMAFTMLIVIPLFAWLGTFLAAPVAFALVDAPDAPVVVVGRHGEDARFAFVAGPDTRGERVFSIAGDVYGYTLVPPGQTVAADADPVRVENTKTGATFLVHTQGAPVIPEAARIGELDAGTYTFTLAPPPSGERLTLAGEPAGPHAVDTAVLVAVAADGSVQAVAVDESGEPLTLAGPATLYAVVAEGLAGEQVTGTALLRADGPTDAEFTLTDANVVALDPARFAAPIYPYSAQLPWQDPWSLQDFWWILPHWILLYSLFGIPFGQIAQRALKLWEYRHVDLDRDGRKAGESL